MTRDHFLLILSIRQVLYNISDPCDVLDPSPPFLYTIW
ncbi:uncharacterized protein METZ01_LOCUS313596 [marine metagenome]|uniref:Uncharacterized protein n=1 Tax=marine metagenome TaxID=408172 RepID=A0A382NM09_9ZZZZ